MGAIFGGAPSLGGMERELLQLGLEGTAGEERGDSATGSEVLSDILGGTWGGKPGGPPTTPELVSMEGGVWGRAAANGTDVTGAVEKSGSNLFELAFRKIFGRFVKMGGVGN